MNTMMEKKFENAKEFAAHIGVTEAQAEMMLGYIWGNGYDVYPKEKYYLSLVDVKEPENGVVAIDYEEELFKRISFWNYERLQDSEVVGEQREQALKDMVMIDSLLGDFRDGIPIGNPTVKELIAILSKLPEAYRVSCCCADNYLYLWGNSKSITIDCEWYLA